MQSLFYGIVYGSTYEQNTAVYKDDYETLNCPEYQTINQIHRKIKIINELKKYISNAGKKTIYHRYILNTTIHEYEYGKPIVYTIQESPIFKKLYEYKTSHDPDDFLRTIGLIEI